MQKSVGIDPLYFKPIGFLQSCFKEKFGIPRQAGLNRYARAQIVFPNHPQMREALRGLEDFSHLWVIFGFHAAYHEGWKPLVRPPRLGGSKKIGVLATRSPHRPNPIGISAVKIENIQITPNSKTIEIEVSGGDFLEGSPVFDIKPYVPYADRIASAKTGWAQNPKSEQKKIRVAFSAQSRNKALALEKKYPNFRKLVCQLIRQDPRPAFKRKKDRNENFAVRLLHVDVHWRFQTNQCTITEILEA